MRYLGIHFLSIGLICIDKTRITLKNSRLVYFCLPRRIFAGDEEVSYIYSATGEKLVK